MKIKNGVSLNSLEEILADYADLPVAQSDVTGLVSALAGKADAPIAQSDVTGLVSALSGKVSNTDFQAFLDVLDAQPSVINALSYKATTIPTGTATDGELCLCDDGKIYEHTGGAWDAGEALAVGERYWHFLTGSDVSGDSGSHTPGPNFYLYEWDGEAFSTYQVTFGTFACVEDLAKFYWYNGTEVVEFSSAQLTANELLAIQNASLQGTDTVAKVSDIPAAQLTSDELTAIQAASLTASDTVAKVSDIPAAQPLYMPNVELPLDRMKVSEYCWTYYTDVNYLNCLRSSASTAKEGLELYYSIACEAGVYELVCVCPTNGDLGKLNVYVDDVYQGYIDTYTSALFYNISFSVFLNISTSGNHTIKFVNTKNPSSSGYYVLFAKMVLRKIDLNWQFGWSHGRYSNHKVMVNTIVAGNALQRNTEAAMKPFHEYWLQNAPALNDEFHSPDLYLPAGTYQLGMTILKNTNEGILSIYENDTLVDTYDFYAAAPEFNVIPTFTVTIDAARATKFKFKAFSKHAASSNYYIAISNLYLKKTA